MRQVPMNSSSLNSSIHSPKYLLLGSGRLARHFTYYLQSRNTRVLHWSRGVDPAFNSMSPSRVASASERFAQLAPQATVILAALSDRALKPVYDELSPFAPTARWAHFSGSFSHPNMFAAHPLMTFPETLHELNLYGSMAFVGDGSREEFAEIFPNLENSYYHLDGTNRNLYHALCALSGNFSQLLWQTTENAFLRELHLPKEILDPYKIAIFNGILRDPAKSLTGPLVRGDLATVEQHILSLGETRGQVYRAMQRLFEKERG